jgi:uncharacterized protein (TIGR02466 family)|tara:strand:- start:2120 stop:2698 length:579 start_codon:yes stop_codon:yes gene_type:complete
VEAYSYFASSIYREERPEWVGETLEHTQKHYDQMPPHVVKQTGSMANDPDLGYLTSYFRDKGVSILKDQGYLTDEYEFYVSGMWGQEFACTGSNIMHVHGDSQISGFYFLEVPEGGSYPIFDDPRPGKRMADLWAQPSDQVTMSTPQVHFNNAQAGTMMLFNSWLPHMITPNQSNNPTKFIHFILSQRKRFI